MAIRKPAGRSTASRAARASAESRGAKASTALRETKASAALRASVLRANVEIAKRGLAPFTFGNASAIDRARGLVVIKPSGVPFAKLKAADLVVTDLEGRVVEGKLRPSADLATHLELYRRWPAVGGVVHTHSHFATVWAQAGQEIPCYGTTHADYFNGPVPVTREMTAAEIARDYELNTGKVIVERFDGEPTTMPAVLVAGHASFVWGPTVDAAVETASILEEVARMAYHTAILNPATEQIAQALLHKHFRRKHGPGAYYGQ
jgi:L-ribulose-5-phosphate 4-epimerase